MKEQFIQCLRVGEIDTNCWIYSPAPDSGSCVIIDPGDEAPLIIDHLEKLNLTPQYILLTHGHFDHLAALPELRERFPAAIAIHRDDASCLGPEAYEVHRTIFKAAAGGGDYLLDKLYRPLPPADLLLTEGDIVGPFMVLHVPGHSRGSIAFYDEEAELLFSGDTLFQGDCGRTDLPGGSKAEMGKSLRRLFSMKGSIRVFPGHGPETTIEEERNHG